MIELKGISKSYGSLEVLHDISLTINSGEIMTIVGPSGAGKTTLLQIAGTLDRPDSGKVLFQGTDVLKLKDRKLSRFRNKNIGFIFQFHQLLPEFSAIENVAIPAFINGAGRRESLEKAKSLLEELGLGERLKHKPAQLSGGEKQRVAIARALINNPEIIFADEPTGSLDSRNRLEIQQIIQSLKEEHGQTFVIVTHDAGMAEIADTLITMADGRIITDFEDESSSQSENQTETNMPDFSELSHEKENSEELLL